MQISRLVPRPSAENTSYASSDLTASHGPNQASIAVNSHKDNINVYFCNASEISTSILLKLASEVNCVASIALTREFQNLELIIVTNASFLVANLSELISKGQRKSFSRSLGFVSAFSSPIISLPSVTEFTITAANIASAVTHNINTTHLSSAIPYCYSSIPFGDRSILLLGLADNVIMALDYYTSFACQYPAIRSEATYKGLCSIQTIENTHCAYVQTYENTHMLLVLHEVPEPETADTSSSQSDEEGSVWRDVDPEELPQSMHSMPTSEPQPLHISLLQLPQQYFSDATTYVSLSRTTGINI